MIFDLIHSILILKDSVHGFEKYCVSGLKVNRKKIQEYVDNSLMLVTALAPTLGYDTFSKIAHLAVIKHLSLRDAAIELGHLTKEQFDKLVVPEKMT